MRLLKPLLYAIFLGLLASCSWGTSIPPKVLEGQRGVYQGISVLDENIQMILQAYEDDNKAAVTYHINYVYEEKIDIVRRNASLDEATRSESIANLERKRDEQIRSTFLKIESRRKEMMTATTQNVFLTRKLVEAVYGYMSATPITIDNVDFWIEKLVQVSYGRK